MDELFPITEDSLERFLVHWHGPPHLDEAPNLAEGSADIPQPLRDWYQLTARWRAPVTVQNRILLPAQLYLDDGKLVFWVENQRVWLWAVDPHGDDPEVFDRENEPGANWYGTGTRLSHFLVHVAVFEAILGAKHHASAADITPEQLVVVLKPLQPLPMIPWRWPSPGHQLHAGDGLLAFTGPNPELAEGIEANQRWDLFLAAESADALSNAENIPGIDWDAYSWNT